MKTLLCSFLILTSTLFAQAESEPYDCGSLKEAFWQRPIPMRITLDEFKITPKHLVLKACQPYTFTIVNIGKFDHEFIAEEFFNTVYVDQGDAEPLALEAGYRGFEVQENEQVEWTVIATTPGTYKVKCPHFGHNLLGMRGTIRVEAP